MVLVNSATKGMASLAMALAQSRALFEYDERVSTYWPEFGQQWRDRITVRQLLSHQAGLFALDERLDRNLVADPDRLAAVLARQRPAWEPGTRQAYHGITLRFYEGELPRRVDPRHRTLGHYFQEELAGPVGLDFYIWLPGEIPNARLARLRRFGMVEGLLALPLPLALSVLNPRSNFRSACSVRSCRRRTGSTSMLGTWRCPRVARLRDARDGGFLRVCRPRGLDRLRVHPEPDGDETSGPGGTRAAHGTVPLHRGVKSWSRVSEDLAQY